MLRLLRRLHFRRAPVAEAQTPRAAGRDAACPYLASAGAGGVSPNGRCTRSGAAYPIHLGYQSVHCVSSRHERCPVFLGLRDSPLAPTCRSRRQGPRQARRAFLIASAVTALTLPLIVTAGAIWSPVPETTRVERPASLPPAADFDEPRVAAAPVAAAVAPAPQARVRIIPDPAEPLVRARALAEEQAALNIAVRVPAAITSGEPGPLDLLFAWEQTIVWSLKSGDNWQASVEALTTPVPAPELLNGFEGAHEAIISAGTTFAVGAASRPGAEAADPEFTPHSGTGQIATASGRGVLHRLDCASALSGPEGWVDGTIVELVGEGTGRCDGWLLATAGNVTSWVSSALIAPLA